MQATNSINVVNANIRKYFSFLSVIVVSTKKACAELTAIADNADVNFECKGYSYTVISKPVLAGACDAVGFYENFAQTISEYFNQTIALQAAYNKVVFYNKINDTYHFAVGGQNFDRNAEVPNWRIIRLGAELKDAYGSICFASFIEHAKQVASESLKDASVWKSLKYSDKYRFAETCIELRDLGYTIKQTKEFVAQARPNFANGMGEADFTAYRTILGDLREDVKLALREEIKADFLAFVAQQEEQIQQEAAAPTSNILDAAKEIFQSVNESNETNLMSQNFAANSQPTNTATESDFASSLLIATHEAFEPFILSAADCALPQPPHNSEFAPAVVSEPIVPQSSPQPTPNTFHEEPAPLIAQAPARLWCVENFSYENPEEIIEYLRTTFAQTPQPIDPKKGEHFGFALRVGDDVFHFFYTKAPIAHSNDFCYRFSCFSDKKGLDVFALQTGKSKVAFQAYSLLYANFFKNLPTDELITHKAFDVYKDPETLTTGQITALFEWTQKQGRDCYTIEVGQTKYKVVGWNDAYSLLINGAFVMGWVIDEHNGHSDILAHAYKIIYKDICQISPYKHAENLICLRSDATLSDKTVDLVEKSLLIGINRATGVILFNARANYDTTAQSWLARAKDPETGKIIQSYIDACKIVQAPTNS